MLSYRAGPRRLCLENALPKRERLKAIVAPAFVNGSTIVSQLGRRGVRCTAVSYQDGVPGLRSRFAAEKVLLPGIIDHPESLTGWLVSRADLHGALVVPTADDILARLDADRDALAGRFRLVLAPRAAVEVALDKSILMRICSDAEIPVPRTVDASALSDSDCETAAGLGFPVVVKPCYGTAFERAFHAKIITAVSPAGLRDLLDACRARAIRTILQELLPGDGTAAYSAYVTRDGRILGEYTSLRIGLFPPHTGVGYFEVSRRIDDILRDGRKLVETVGYRGAPINVDFKYCHRDGTWRLLDLNARSWRQISMAPLCGLPLADLLLWDYMGRPAPKVGPVRYGVYWLCLRDALAIARSARESAPPLSQYLSMLTSPFSLALWDLADMGPFFADLAPLVARRLRHAPASAPGVRQ